ncbi:AIPR family protein [Spiroplasma endosymbiont of Othius punctulatus]|uniref:AIPR family protein n=1 Tax=Spiroplasma endosymbiont of Othius punctulatus TaxID=3066289 RepID=UPI0030CE51C6
MSANKKIKNFKREVALKILDQVIPDEYGSLDDSSKFTIVSMHSILNSKNISEPLETIYEHMFTDGGQDFAVDAIAIYINRKFIAVDEDLKQLKGIVPWNINIIINQSKFNSSWPMTTLNSLSSYLPLLFNGELKTKNENLKIRQKLISSCLKKRPIDNSVKVEINICNIGDVNDIDKGDNVYIQTKNNFLKNISSQIGISEKNISVIENDLEFIKDNIFSKPFNKNLIFKKNLIDTFSGTENDGYVMLSTVYDYYNFISENNEINEFLFESNVRAFQNSTDINKNISNTIMSENELDFWWLNNGITIIAEDMGTPIGDSIELVNPQIINGLQTSYSIVGSIKKSLESNPNYLNVMKLEDKRKVLIKIIKTKDDKKSEKIIKASNTQNQMNTSTQMANQQILRSLEHDFKAKGLFFERRRKYYSNKKNVDKNFIITPDSTAKYYAATKEKIPAIAKNRTKIFFNSMANFEKVFFKDNQMFLVNVTYMSWNILKYINKSAVVVEGFSLDKIQATKTNFRYHIISLYYIKYLELDPVTPERVEKIVKDFFTILNIYIKNDNEKKENLRSISTSSDFQKIMFKEFEEIKNK